MKKAGQVTTVLFCIWCFSCKPMEQEVCIDPAKINTDAICTMQYDPVCGCDNKTYSNACVANNAGLTSYTKGACPEVK